MNSCEIPSMVTALACTIAKDKTADELSLLSSIFNQLGDTLATISAGRSLCNEQIRKI